NLRKAVEELENITRNFAVNKRSKTVKNDFEGEDHAQNNAPEEEDNWTDNES
ncbi:hypothetical protein AVEN_119876-1, partial [Araneus ventricosus]